ncbi:hypothetical protein P0L94_00905 [Microbacter sp. GSS18]|nr:hypothetical protein P0L94_00905 [Microbacter sp. GSS18]
MPRSITVVDDKVYLEIIQDPKAVALIDDLDAMVVPYAGHAAVHESEVARVRDVLVKSGQLVQGAFLIKNPYEGETYESAETAIEAFAVAKYHALANVVRLLGAREIKFVEVRMSNESANWVANAMLHLPKLGADAEASKEMKQKLKEKLQARMVFPGSPPDTEGATAYLTKRNLQGDQQMRDLIEMRTGTNPISHYKMTFSGTRESASNFSAGLKLAGAAEALGVQLGGKFTKTLESIRDIDIETEINF